MGDLGVPREPWGRPGPAAGVTTGEPEHLLDRPIAPDWLDLRRPADHAARDGAGDLIERVRRLLNLGRQAVVIDVGAGTGANRAYLEPRLGVPADWVLLDHDVRLLDRVGDDSVRVVGGIDQLARLVATYEPALVTCSALLDLLTVDELDTVANVLADHGVPGLFSLTVDGTERLDPGHDEDAPLLAAFNAHQTRDGRPGPSAAAHLAAACERLGLAVTRWETPWLLDHRAADLVDRLLCERTDAAVEQAPELAERAAAWLVKRRDGLRSGALRVEVGHVDLLVEPRAGSTETV